MRQILLLVLVCVIFGFTAEAQRTPREETLVEIVKAGKPRHPYQDEYEQMLYPTVRITAGFSTGSGVVISYTQIYILTAAHVVEDETTVNIELYNTTVITGTVVITDTIKDLALIKPSGLMSYSAQLAPRKYTPYLFTPVWAVGCSLGLPPRPSQGIISVVETDHLEITAPILPGNSGGPVFDGRTYEVIGIAVWVKVYNGQLITTMAGVVPINQIYQFLEPLINTNTHK